MRHLDVGKGILAAILAGAVGGNAISADDTETAALKAQLKSEIIAEMRGVFAEEQARAKAQIDALKAEIAAERQRAREKEINAEITAAQRRAQIAAPDRALYPAFADGEFSAGGGVQSANGGATIKIGGDFRLAYSIGWANRYQAIGASRPNYEKNTVAGWAVEKAALVFNIDLSPDTGATIALRADGGGSVGPGNILDNAYWTWKNIGGAPLSLQAGLQSTPFGMNANADTGGYDWGGTNRALITDPFVKHTLGMNGAGTAGGINDNGNATGIAKMTNSDLTTIGVFAKYALLDEQLFLKGGIFAADVGWSGGNLPSRGSYPAHRGNSTGFNAPPIFTGNTADYRNELRNYGFVNHALAVAYNPAFIEGLHLEASYQGVFDNAHHSDVWFDDGRPFLGAYAYDAGSNSYSPSFDLAAKWDVNERLTLIGEAVITFNPWYVEHARAYALSFAGDYRLTEKLMLGWGFDWAHTYLDVSQVGEATHNGRTYPHSQDRYTNYLRASFGGRYAFGNGIYLQAQYYHDWLSATNFGDGNTKDADTLVFRTGYNF